MPASVMILGAGAAGLMCAVAAAERGRRVVVVDHAQLPGRKLAITGGGRCNFSNRVVEASHFLSANPHFTRSALARFTPWDAIAMVEEAGIAYEERDLGQLFLLERATRLVDGLSERARMAGVRFELGREVLSLRHLGDGGFELETSRGPIEAAKVVVATGGLSYTGTGATGIGYELARSFSLPVVPARPALVPLTWSAADRTHYSALSGIALEVVARCPGSPPFRSNLLFTHRGVSGPAILQVSSCWQAGQPVTVDLLPDSDLDNSLRQARQERPRVQLRTLLAGWLPRRLVAAIDGDPLPSGQMGQLSNEQLAKIVDTIHGWTLQPAGTEGYEAAEVTAGGVDTRVLSSKTMETKDVPGLYFVGEVMDVTGWLGGYNLHWAWASGWCAGQAV